MKDKTKELIEEVGKHEKTIDNCNHHIQQLIFSMCELEGGSCPLCKNWHYPYCSSLELNK